MKKLYKILITLIILGGMLFVVLNIMDINKFKNKILTNCSYSHGGGMLGDVYKITVKKIDDNKSQLSIEEAPSHNERIVTKTYNIDSKVFDDLKQIMNDYNLYSVSKKGKSPFEVLDGPSTSISYTFEDHDGFRISDYQNLNKKDYEAIQKVKDTILSYAIGEPTISIEAHELSLKIDGYNLIYKMNSSKAAEQLVELNGKYLFDSYNDNGKKFHLDEKLDVSNCPLADNDTYGIIAYYEPTGDVIVFHNEFEPIEGLYKLGELDYASQSAYELIKNMENKEYYLIKFK